jgi:type IV secretion system protein VirD4
MYDQIDFFRPRLPTTFGSAKWAGLADIRRAGMLDPGKGKHMGPLIGWLTPAETGGRDVRPLYATGDGHLLTAAPTGSGKGRGQLISNLLWWPGACVVLDIKGEGWEHTHHWRELQGYNVIRFAPSEQGSATWNPLDQINEGCSNKPNDPRRQENARYLANLMITPNPHAKDSYWDNAAKSLLQGLMLHVATAPLATEEEAEEDESRVRTRTMGEVVRLLAAKPETFDRLLLEMTCSEEKLVAQTANMMLQMQTAREQAAGVKTALHEHIAVWAFERVQKATNLSTFSFKELRGDTPTTIYLVIPPEVLTEYRAVLRVLVGSCMRELRETWNEKQHKNKPPIMLFLDEFPQLGYMQPIEDALLYIRSYGVRFWFFVQNIDSFRQHYEKTWRQFVANCSVRMFFGVSDLETAKLVSEMSGQTTVKNRSYSAGVSDSDTESKTETVGTNESSGGSVGSSSGPGGGGSNSSRNWSRGSFQSSSFTVGRTMGRSFTANLSYVGRPLFMPDEVMRMPFGSMLALVKGMPVIRGQLAFWDHWHDLANRVPPQIR